MTWDRVAIVENRLDTYLAGAEPAANRLAPHAALHPGTTLTAAAALGLFEDQLASRQIDVAARELKKTGRSFYTISSAGHENNAVIGARLRIDDPAFLHYRSGGFVMARSRQHAGQPPRCSTRCSASSPPARIRSRRAATRSGAAAPCGSRPRRARSRATCRRRWASRSAWRARSGSASASTCPRTRSSPARSATPARTTRRRWPRSTRPATRCAWACRCRCCSCARTTDTGISVPTPEGWIEATFGAQPHLRYVPADGELDEVWDGRRRRRSTTSARRASRPSCTCARFGCGDMAAATPSRPTGRVPRSRRSRRATRWCATRAA